MSITSSFGLLCVLMLFQSGFTERIRYTITIKTGDVRGAGTDAHVFIILHGTRGSTDKYILPYMVGSFEQGSKDIFWGTEENVGQIKSITIGHDNAGWKPGWFLESVHITQHVTPSVEYQINWNNWIATSEPDWTIVKTISVTQL
ncbi:lipoxygenase homology domain-containing protein 1-like [Physella acuta]|uniref:lipoxygenase homology domain-containing protein 1-like n=1 Tax=Physella acuta TaxID=109671 RepID=UPI0027DB6D2A|nr:lipoxygenase homology domain-containing protein 1-like [Physella acuta]